MIFPLPNSKFLIEHFDWLEACNFTNVTPEEVLSRVILKEYTALVGTYKGVNEGLVVYKPIPNTKTVFVIGLYAKNTLHKFYEEFLTMMHIQGFTKMRCSSNHNDKAYQRLLGVTKLWSVYERDI